ncbi:MAG: hypothetical protein HFJ32_05135 [Clostridia bacterium]|nr:hypothetical protein [Clostridia bacterium]
MKEKLRKKQEGICCQHNPSVIGEASTVGIHYQCKPFARIKDATTGITLVALVVTIVVLLILAGITIMYTIGENSIFKKAQEAKDKTAEAIKNEQEYMNEVDNMVDKYMNGIGNGGEPDTPTENPWAKIDRIAKAIAKDDSVTNDSTQAAGITEKGENYDIKVGDVLEVEYEGEVRRVRVLGFKHDDLVDQTVYGGTDEKASISFEFLDFMTGEDYMPMNSTNTNENGWANTKMRKDLNGYTTNAAVQSGAIGGLGANLNNKSYIKQVKKKYIETYDNASSVTTCNDYLWLLAASEVVNAGYNGGDTRGYAITKEGEQYKYYQGVTDAWDSSSTGRQKRQSSSSSIVSWWLRSLYYANSNSFCSIVHNGGSNGGSASYSIGVAPGFSI